MSERSRSDYFIFEIRFIGTCHNQLNCALGGQRLEVSYKRKVAKWHPMEFHYSPLRDAVQSWLCHITNTTDEVLDADSHL